VEIGVLERDAHQLLVSLMKLQKPKQTVNAERHSYFFCSQALLLGELLLSLVLLFCWLFLFFLFKSSRTSRSQSSTQALVSRGSDNDMW
jgi:formate-dependent nitrite reductase membrane component NrfD